MKELPSGLSPEEQWAVVQRFLKEKCEQKDGSWLCKTCGSEIQQTTSYVSEHYRGFSVCTGSGRCKTKPVPFCPKCEGDVQPSSSCVHV